MQSLNDLLQSANEALEARQFDKALSAAREVLAAVPDSVPALHIAGLAVLQSGRPHDAVDYLAQAAALDGADAMVLMHLGIAQGESGNGEQAVESFRRVVAHAPQFLAAYGNLGLTLLRLDRLEEAEAVYRSLLEKAPDNPAGLEGMGQALLRLRRYGDAADVLRSALRVSPRSAISHSNLGAALIKLNDPEAAISHFEDAHRLDPANADILVNLGKAYSAANRNDAAIDALRRAVGANPRHREAHNELGNALKAQGRLTDAVAEYRRHLEVVPDDAMAHNNLGNAYSQMGRIGDAETAFATAFKLRPDYPLAHSNYLFNLNYWPDRSADAVFREHRAWAARFEPAPPPILPARRRAEGDRIRIGYVSPDFKSHSVAYFLAPLLEAHDRSRFEIFCYAEVPSPDAVTAKFKALADHWRWTHTLSDDDLYEVLRADDLDLVVDIAGHSAGNRLPVIARRVAPVQVNWLGYPNTTGLQTMDYRFSDATADPEGDADKLCSETLYRLPDTFLCFSPDSDARPAGPPPCIGAGYVTFGSFNNLPKMNEPLVDVWAEILRRVPGSRLVLKCRQLADDTVREHYRVLFTARGIDADRIDLIDWIAARTGHLEAYGRIDIALDTFPYAGTTTTCEALWMGVATVTLRGERHAGRVGASLLTTVGHPELIAGDTAAYVEVAVDLASAPDRIAAYSAGLRDAMAKSPLCDAVSFARVVEAAFQTMIGAR